MFSPGFWLRPIAISAALLLFAILWFQSAYPGAALPIPQLVSGLFVVPLMMGLVSLIHLVIPRHLQVRKKCVQTSDGIFIKAAQIDDCVLDISDLTRPIFVVRYTTRRGIDRELRSALSSRVKIDRLALSMPEGIELRLVEKPELADA